jgi:D-alanyl-lipoteichoic acid acyltransferase DltB (MBOAT superfamily)
MPEVLNVFRIIINYIKQVVTYPIHLNQYVSVTIWQITTFVMIMVACIKFITLDFSRWNADRAEKFSRRQRMADDIAKNIKVHPSGRRRLK